MGAALNTELNKYFSLLTPTQKKSVISMIKSFVGSAVDKRVERISIEQYNKEIDEAVARVEEGEFYSQEEVEKMAAKW